MASLSGISFTFEPVGIKVVTSGLPVPKRATKGSAGLDLYANDDVTLIPGKRFRIPTGLFLEIPPSIYGRIACRSGLAYKGMDVFGGVIDSDYRAEVGVLGVWFGDEEYVIKKGDRCAQIIFEFVADLYLNLPLVEVESIHNLSKTDRDGGFGSTGKK
jgi:dUTP pyrophosphatase